MSSSNLTLRGPDDFFSVSSLQLYPPDTLSSRLEPNPRLPGVCVAPPKLPVKPNQEQRIQQVSQMFTADLSISVCEA